MTSRNAGFTLAEVLVASFCVAFGLVGFLASFSALSRTARMVDAESRAMHRARQQIERLRSCSFASPELDIGAHSISGGVYIVSSNSSTSTIRQITVIQYSVAPNNATSQVSLATIFTSALHK